MTTLLAEMTRPDVAHWLDFNVPIISAARDEWLEATRKYADRLAQCRGVFEHASTTPASFVEAIVDRADSRLAEEVRRDMDL